MEKGKRINLARLVFAIVYFMMGVAIIAIFHKQIFYLTHHYTNYNFYRFFWCLSFSLIGFSSLITLTLRLPESPLPSYITYYPLLLIFNSAIAFSIFNIFEKTQGYIFYYASGATCLVLSYLVDNLLDIILNFIDKLKDKIKIIL